MMHPLSLALALAIATTGTAGAQSPAMTTKDKAAPASGASDAAVQSNPFFQPSPLPFHYPQFDKIKDSDFAPAFDRGMADNLREIAVIADNPAAPTFDNTIVALEKSGQLLDRAQTVFYALVGADTNDARKALQSQYAPLFAAHGDAVALNPRLFARIQALYDKRDKLGLDAQGVRLVERYHTSFVRSGASLSETDKARLRQINTESAALGTKFGQNVLAEVNDSALVLDRREQLAGLSDEQIDAAQAEAKARKLDGKYVLTLLNTTIQPAESSLTDRATRERLHKASIARGSRGNQWDNTAIVSKVAAMRAERANMLGFPTYAAYALADQTAENPEAVNTMLGQLAPPAVANARREAAEIQKVIDAEGGKFQLQPWDWSYYTEKVRKQKYDFDGAQLKPYLEMTNVLENGVFFAANKLYGLSFKRRTDLPVYHPDVWTYDVFDANGKQLAIFLFDPYARASKRGGAWASAYVSQNGLLDMQPVIANHLNIPKPADGKPTLLTWDEVTTTFHEFGHALHGMFSNVEYPYFSGTSVPRDFVEFPSQVNEMWSDWPEVLANYAKHYQTGAPMPQALLDKVQASATFNQGYETTSYLGAALLDQSWHQLKRADVPAAEGVMAFEAAALKRNGVDYAPVPPRYRTPYFSHILGGYAAGYYAYIWSEILDANTVEWFEANGGLTRANGDRFRDKLLSRGGSKDASQLFVDFTGHGPKIEPLLVRRGLVPEAAAAKPVQD